MRVFNTVMRFKSVALSQFSPVKLQNLLVHDAFSFGKLPS